MYTNPTMDTLLSEGDHALVFGNSDCIRKVIAAISLPLERHPGTTSKFSLAAESLKTAVAAPREAMDSITALKAAALKYGGRPVKVHPEV
jgi:hypothetical protein